MRVSESCKIPVKVWADKVEESAIAQIKNLANLPFAFHHVAIMPDCHTGYGMPIGGVLATKGVVIPYAVGVDIGCGMCAIKTTLKAEQLTKIAIKKLFGGTKENRGGIRSCIPMGTNKHSKKQDYKYIPKPMELVNVPYDFDIVGMEYPNALKQIGTLGGGNHFIEIQKDTEGYVWIMLHSGSRHMGFAVANHYNKLAIKLNEKYFSQVPTEWELAFLPLDSEEGNYYLMEMNYCVKFALANRKLMMNRICEVVSESFKDVSFEPMINIAHNYAVMEHHYGQNVVVHRKGATLAREGVIGIIPGSQGTKSYIVEGKGNPDSFMSCSHGAGRVMSRTKAKENLNLEEEIKKMDDQGIVHGMRAKSDLDEASSSYKSIDKVMENQKDLVKILVELTPIGVLKG